MSDEDEMGEGILLAFLTCKNGHTFGTEDRPGEHECPTCQEKINVLDDEQVIEIANCAKLLADALRDALPCIEMVGTFEALKAAEKAIEKYDEAMETE